MKVADPKDVKTIVGDMSEENLRCRDFGHKWVQYRVARVRGGFERSLYCPSCKTSRHQYVSSRTGEVLASNYKYQPDYAIHGLGRIQAESKGILRLESLSRSTISGDYAIEVDGLIEGTP